MSTCPKETFSCEVTNNIFGCVVFYLCLKGCAMLYFNNIRLKNELVQI